MKHVYVNYDLVSKRLTHDFDIVTKEQPEGTVTSLVRTNDVQWTSHARDKVALRITDNGEGLQVETFDTDGHVDKVIVLAYDVAEELFILLSQQDFAPFEIRESKTTMKWPLSQ